MRAILIDTKAREVREVEIGDAEGQSLTDLQKAVGGYIEIATAWPNGDTLYVNEEGMFGLTPESMFFELEGAHQPFAGNGIIAGSDREGETTRTLISVEEVRKSVRFLTLAQVREMFR